MRRACLFLLVCGCASANQPERITTSQPTIVASGGSDADIMGEAPISTGADIAAPPASVWLAVKKVYTDMEIPVTLEDAPHRQIGNKNFYKTRQLAGQPMTQFVDCGNDMTGAKASSYRIYISSVTSVAPNTKGGSNVQTLFVTTGQDMGGTSSDRITCSSTGRFEALFLRKVAAELGK
jgi:hypothetical protein